MSLVTVSPFNPFCCVFPKSVSQELNLRFGVKDAEVRAHKTVRPSWDSFRAPAVFILRRVVASVSWEPPQAGATVVQIKKDLGGAAKCLGTVAVSACSVYIKFPTRNTAVSEFPRHGPACCLSGPASAQGPCLPRLCRLPLCPGPCSLCPPARLTGPALQAPLCLR